ncbi:MAG: methyltransferase domain-containing protein [Polyangiales bacterium]
MDRAKFSAIAFTDHDVCSPIDGRRLDEVLALLELPPGARVLDLGCGKGEVLRRVIARYGAHGVGVDRSPAMLDEARARLASVPPPASFTLREQALEDLDPGVGDYDLVINLGAIPDGGYRAMLRAMKAHARPGGKLLVGEGFWARDPAPEYLASFGIAKESYGSHADNVFAAIEEGLTPRYAITSGVDEWDAFEGRYANAVERYVAAHPSDPDAPAMKARIDAWRGMYLRWGRDTLGFGTYLFAT